MMDDDARPAADALQALLAVVPDTRNVYGSTAVAGERLAWTMTLAASGGRVTAVAELPAQAEVEFVPFLGIFVHRELVARIGLPAAEFFLAADDLEYCLRARRAGARLLMVAASRIEHPPSQSYRLTLPGKTLHCLTLPPWKRYYDTRNRIFVARRHFGLRLFTATLPSIALRLLATLWHEPRRLAQCWATLAGVIDGLAGRGGRRHQCWRLGA